MKGAVIFLDEEADHSSKPYECMNLVGTTIGGRTVFDLGEIEDVWGKAREERVRSEEARDPVPINVSSLVRRQEETHHIQFW